MSKPGTFSRLLRFFIMMINFKHILSATVAATLRSGAAQANEKQNKVTATTVVSLDDAKEFISIPMDTTVDLKDVETLNREFYEEYDTDYSNTVTYDLFGNIDANVGVLKNKKVKSRYKVRSAMQPRGRYFKAPVSKVGAGISSKF